MKLSRIPPSIILRSIVSAMLLLALAPLFYGYYILLRWITCGAAAYSASLASNQSKKGSAIVLGALSISTG